MKFAVVLVTLLFGCKATHEKIDGTLSMGEPSLRAPVGAPVGYPEGAPVVAATRGSVDLSLVATELKGRLGDLDECYKRRLAVRPALSGTVVIHWTIAETGKVPEACVTTDTVGDPEVTECVNRLVQDGTFPAPRGGAVDVSIPFVFAAG